MTAKQINSLSKILLLISVLLPLPGCQEEVPIGKWKDGIIPYYLTGSFSDDDIDVLQQAMADWEEVANVQFIEVTPRAGAYRITKVSENQWSSSVGENNSDCEMIFGSGGDKYSHVAHELGHALGLLHEHQRPDRDSYIKIIYSNILDQYLFNYDKQDNPLIVEENFDYDYTSIMHYPANSFSKDGTSNTMESLDSEQPINRLGIITTDDALKAQEIYGAPVEE